MHIVLYRGGRMKEKRNTWQKNVIFSVLKEMRSHPTAQELYNELVARGYGIGKSTIYRVLAEAADEGTIENVYTIDNREHFDGDTSMHYHMRCKNCGRIYDSCVAYNKDLTELSVMADKGFTVLTHNLEFVCICPGCQ